MTENFFAYFPWVLGVILFLVFFVWIFLAIRGRRPVRKVEAPKPEGIPEVAPVAPPKLPAREGSLERGLSKTRALWEKLRGVSSSDAKALEQMEELLLESDVGVTTAQFLLSKMEKGTEEPFFHQLQTQVQRVLTEGNGEAKKVPGAARPYVISLVGVNGAGKTTTVGKLAHRFQKAGFQVLMGAGDTFRAAAVDQLKVWAERTGADIVVGREGGDPAAVMFDAVAAGKARGKDIVLLDTAGRLHTKASLMDELQRMHKVVQKVIPEAPHETWLVVDATLGQNSLSQAREFSQTLGLTGIIVTKLDGTARGGVILAIAHELHLPIQFLGVGEGVDDLIPFQPRAFAEAMLRQESRE